MPPKYYIIITRTKNNKNNQDEIKTFHHDSSYCNYQYTECHIHLFIIQTLPLLLIKKNNINYMFCYGKVRQSLKYQKFTHFLTGAI